jgi:hypothetical protein
MITGGLLLGLLLGMRHVLEPDHLAAVSTMLAAPGRRQGAALLGMFWGLGHTLSLLLFGGVLILLRRQVPSGLSAIFELGVAAMLVVLGLLALGRAVRALRRGDAPAAHGHAPVRDLSRWRPVTVGVVHGLAGTGALTATVFAQLPTPVARLGYLTLFGGGSILGMAAVLGVAGLSLSRALVAGGRVPALLAAASGAVSLGLGLRWAAGPLAALLGG